MRKNEVIRTVKDFNPKKLGLHPYESGSWISRNNQVYCVHPLSNRRGGIEGYEIVLYSDKIY